MNELERLHHRFCNYSETFKGNTAATIKWLKQAFRLWISFSHAESPGDISRQAIEDWIFFGRSERSWSPKTIRNRLQALGLFFDWMVREGLLRSNPVAEIPKPKLPVRIPRHLTQEEAFQLLDWTKNFPFGYLFERSRAAAIIATFIYTGVRAEELRMLKMSAIDLANRTLFVASGKGNKDRIIPITRSLALFMEAYLRDRRRMRRSCPYFFTAMRQDSQMGPLVIKRLVDRLRERSGIYFYPHMLRHTFATLMLEGGCDLFSLSKMMGHSDIKTTTIYLSATTGHLREQIRKHPLDALRSKMAGRDSIRSSEGDGPSPFQASQQWSH